MPDREHPLLAVSAAFGRINSYLAVSAVTGVLAAGLLTPVVAVAGVTAAAATDFFEELPAELERAVLAQPTTILATDGSLIATLYEENRQPVTLDQVSPYMVDALISIEDYRFYEHGGADLEGILGAVVSNITSDTTRGASTITQQYVTNVLVDSALQNGETATLSGDKSVGDKLREIKLAVTVEKQMTKEQILEGYLNIVPFSGTTYGVQAASQYFFNVDAQDLNIQQSALLAGLVNGPTLYSPTENPDGALQRRNLVLDTMLQHGKITQEEHDTAAATDLGLDVMPVSNGCVGAAQAPYFCDYVTHLVLNDPAYGETLEDREDVLYRSGLTIETTLEPTVQAAAQTAVDETADPDTTDASVGHAMVSVEPDTGNILSMAQNTRYEPGEETGNSVLNFSVDQYQDGDPAKSLGGVGGFQPGSTFKPFTVAAWVESGKSLDTVINGSKRTYPEGDEWTASCLPGGTYTVVSEDGDGYTPQNYGDTNYGSFSLLDGLAQSYNTQIMEAARQLDMCRIFEIAYDMGVHDGKSSSGEAEQLDVLAPGLIGGVQDVAPLSMATAYAGFAAEGNVCQPRALTAVTAADGTSYPVPAVACERAISAESAQGVNYATQEVMSTGSGQLLDYGDVPMAGKTGTNDQRSQTWFIGYNSAMATASWVGNWKEGNTSLSGLDIGGTVYPEIDGSLIAAPSWASFMEQIATQYAGDEFTTPPASVVNQ